MPMQTTAPLESITAIDAALIPEHVAIIMDGNRRWAMLRGLKPQKGHEQGVEALEKIMKHCVRRGVKTLTVYAFSTENWKRTKQEVKYLLTLIVKYLRAKRATLLKNGISLQTIGELSDFPTAVQKAVKRTTEILAGNKRLKLNLALGYGGRTEIVSAIKRIVADGVNQGDVTEELVNRYLYTNRQKDPDLLIRTGGQQRLSNFLLWQSSYSEFYFTNVLWPDFNEQEFDKALNDFAARKRNFGK